MFPWFHRLFTRDPKPSGWESTAPVPPVFEHIEPQTPTSLVVTREGAVGGVDVLQIRRALWLADRFDRLEMGHVRGHVRDPHPTSGGSLNFSTAAGLVEHLRWVLDRGDWR